MTQPCPHDWRTVATVTRHVQTCATCQQQRTVTARPPCPDDIGLDQHALTDEQRRENVALTVQAERAQQERDMLTAVYTERAHLVAALSKLFPASLETDPQEPEWPVCIVDLPTGQASWHVSAADLYLFAHLPRDAGRQWDGHTTLEKYARLDALPES